MPFPSKTRKTDRQAAEKAGRRAEALAGLYFRLLGYRTRDRRFRTPVGEIDLVVEGWGIVVFVEVKARRSPLAEEEALLAVNRARLARAAQFYIMLHPALSQARLRFDVIFLAPRQWPRHVKGAFETNA